LIPICQRPSRGNITAGMGWLDQHCQRVPHHAGLLACALRGSRRQPFLQTLRAHFTPPATSPRFPSSWSGFTAAIACLFPLETLIHTLIVIRIVNQVFFRK
jgi:hypothetical protein